MAWAWGASRIIDALEMTDGHGVDTTRLSAVGCSRNGKAAASIGIFDDRIALVSGQSPGSGTRIGWRPDDFSVDTSDLFESDNNVTFESNKWQDGDIPSLD